MGLCILQHLFFFICLSGSKFKTVGLDFGHIQGNDGSFHVTMTFSLISSRAVLLAHSSMDVLHNISDTAVYIFFFFRLKKLCIPLVHSDICKVLLIGPGWTVQLKIKTW